MPYPWKDVKPDGGTFVGRLDAAAPAGEGRGQDASCCKSGEKETSRIKNW